MANTGSVPPGATRAQHLSRRPGGQAGCCASLALLAACFSPARDFSGIPACDPGTPCAPPLSCVEGQCVQEATVELAMGSFHACARSAHSVACWGLLQLDDEGAYPALVARRVEGLHAPRALAAGDRHHCALQEGGEVLCFGDNAAGQLGALGSTPRRSAPIPRVRAVAASGQSTCTLHEDDGLLCFGRGGAVRSATAGVEVLPGDVAELAAGDDFVCWRRSGGEVRCRGIFSGALSTEPAERIAAQGDQVCVLLGGGRVRCASAGGSLADVPAPGPARGIAAQAGWACALLDPSGVACTGAPEEPLLPRGAYPFPLDLAPRALGLGTSSACWLDEAGQAFCAGPGEEGELGLSPDLGRLPARVRGAVTDLTLGFGHTCVRTGAELECFGRNKDGALGVSPGPPAVARHQIPGRLRGSGASATTCTLDQGEVRCFGADPGGLMTPGGGWTEPRLLATLREVHDLAVGAEHLCAVTGPTRAIECRGRGREGQLGGGLPPGADQVVAGAVYSCARWGEAVRCWGTLGGRSSSVAWALDGLPPVAELAAGGYHVCARSADGRVFCAGANDARQIADTEATTFDRPVQLALPFPAVEVALGTWHGCARDQGGRVSCFGQNRQGRLGRGPGAQVGSVMLDLPPVARIALGREHGCALTAESELWCWGSNAFGQLDGQPLGARPHPVRLPWDP